MMSNFIRHFNGTDELTRVTSVPNAKFAEMGGVRSKANWVDSFQRLAGVTADGRLVPVERTITYKRFASKHECNSKCMNGKINGTCECACGGKNHGLGGVFSSLKEAA